MPDTTPTPTPTPGQELASLDFRNLIGSPLIAVVEAQGQSALSTLNFVQTIGFEQSEGTTTSQISKKPAAVTFSYSKNSEDGEKEASLTVPLLTMLPIPYLRIQEVNLEFLAKINSIQYQEINSKFKISGAAEGQAGWLWGAAKLKVSSSYQRQSKEGSTITRDYSMRVQVKAVQEEIPGGLERVINILESLIEEKVK